MTGRLPLAALRTFEAAARHLSFRDAADELCVSPTTVSNQIRQLEKDWKVKLFHRHVRAVTLTEKGQALALVLGRAFGDIRAGVEQHIAPPARTVSIAVGPIFGARWLGPRLARFASEHPDIGLLVQHGDRISDAGQLRTDLAIDWGTGAWRGLLARRLLDIRYSPVISPELARQAGPLADPSRLAGLTIIHQHDGSEWQNWFALAGYPGLRPESAFTIVDSNMVHRAVRDGQGVALGMFPFMEEDIASGRLLKPFDIDLAPTRAFYLLEPPDARASAPVRAVCEWIMREAGAAR